MSALAIRSRQLFIWLLLALLLLAIITIETTGLLEPKVQIDRHGHVIEPTTDFLPANVDELAAIEIGHDGQVHRFERDHDGAWYYHGHDHADDGAHSKDDGHGRDRDHDHDGAVDDHHHADEQVAERINKAFAALGRAKIERYLQRAQNPTAYGATKPDMLINIYGENSPRPIARYAVGDIAPDTYSRYVMVVGSFAIVTIPNYQIENLLMLIEAVTKVERENK